MWMEEERRVTAAAAADYEGDVIIQQADDDDEDDEGKIENSDKRIGERRKEGDGIDDCGGAFPGRWNDATERPSLFLPSSVWPIRRQIAMFVSG